ncbi:MAG: class I SAM-dependent methyltransferase, partial [Pirellulaceae bacterium]
RRSKTMFAAVKLGVFDALAAGPRALASLADELGAHPDGLERLLDACVGLQLLQRRGHNYENTRVATTYLTRGSPQRLTGYIRYSNDVMWKLWTHLDDAVREGSHRWRQAYGWEGPIFSHFFKTEEAKREFLMGMHGFGLISSPHVVRAFDLSRYTRMVDLGGATGHLAIAACECWPQLTAQVFDLPDAIPLAREIVGASAVAERVGILPGDFFADPLPSADLYALGRIVHDWSEDKIVRLLSAIHAALPRDGSLLIAEKLLDDDRSGPAWAQMQSLNMLTCTEGKERTFAEYESLLRQVGFAEVTARRTDSPLDAVLATKR